MTAAVFAGNGKSADAVSGATWAAVFFSAWGLAFLSVGLGVGALNHPARRKLFSVIGTTAGVFAVLAWAAMIALGLVVSGYL